jgi:hypothetical protein
MSRKLQQADADFIALQQALAGEYSLDRELGAAAWESSTSRAKVGSARPVAIKVLPPALAARADLREAFLRESQTVARLNHPEHRPVHASVSAADIVYIVMAYVEASRSASAFARAAAVARPGRAHAARSGVGARVRARQGHRASRRHRREHRARAGNRSRHRDGLRHRERDAKSPRCPTTDA